MTPYSIASSLALFCAMAGVTYGQATVVNPQRSARPQTLQGQGLPNSASQGRSAAGQNLDQVIAGHMLLANKAEIELAHFAESKAKSDKVKELARMMSQDHQKLVNKIQTMVPQHAQGAQGPGNRSQAQATKVANRPGTSPQGRGQDAQLFEMEQRCTEEGLQLTKDLLNEAQGDEFDMAYVGHQVGSHIAMLAKLRGSEAFASPQLQSIMVEATATTEQHLDHVKQLCKAMKKEHHNQGNANDQASSR